MAIALTHVAHLDTESETLEDDIDALSARLGGQDHVSKQKQIREVVKRPWHHMTIWMRLI